MVKKGVTSTDMLRRMIKATKEVESQRNPDTVGDRANGSGRMSFRNTSSFIVPPFGLLQLQTHTNIAGKQRMFEATRPFSASGISSVCIVNGPFDVPAVGNDSFGTAQNGPYFRIKHDGGTYPAGTRLGWKANSFLATLGCMFTVLGPDTIDTDVVCAVLDSSTITGTVTTAIPANESGFGVVATTGPSISYSVKTLVGAISVGSTVLCFPRKGEWIAVKVC
jgi:hypothetical protein